MKAAEMPAQKTGSAYVLGPGEGDPRWVLGELDTLKATPAQTGGLFALKESRSGRGPPLHVHQREDEASYVIEGDVTFFIGDDVVAATAGSWIYLPRGIPHSLRIDSDQARTLWLIVPGDFASFFTDLFPPAIDGNAPATGQPDPARMAATAERYGVTILGPTPDK